VILIVDDDPGVRHALVRVLSEMGHAVSAVGDGREAFEWLRSHPRPDLILLDLMMPRINGWEFREELKLDPELKDIPVLILSAFTEAKGFGPLDAEGVFPKPIDLQKLLARITPSK
jgi:CheY-like chemotaxis protein